MDGEKEELLEKAQMAEQAERYPDMVEAMKTLVEMPHVLSGTERNLLSVAYKNVVGSRRSAWRVLTSIESRSPPDTNVPRLAAEYRVKIAEELNEICEQVLKLLDDHLIKQSTDSESKVFYLKMKGDYHRYLAEVADEEGKKEAIDNSEKAYEKASDISKGLEATHPIRLGLALNYSVFYYEIANSPDKACQMAKDSYDSAIEHIKDAHSEPSKDSALILQLLKDNLSLWTSEDQGEGCDGDQDAK